MKIIDRIKCFFGKHVWWNSDYTQIQKGMYAIYLVTRCCIKCGLFRADPSSFDEKLIHERWQEMADLDNLKDSVPPLSEGLQELKHLVDSSSGLDLSKMDIDVESFLKADADLRRNEEKEDV